MSGSSRVIDGGYGASAFRQPSKDANIFDDAAIATG